MVVVVVVVLVIAVCVVCGDEGCDWDGIIIGGGDTVRSGGTDVEG